MLIKNLEQLRVDANLDPIFHFDADPDSQSNTDPDPQHWLQNMPTGTYLTYFLSAAHNIQAKRGLLPHHSLYRAAAPVETLAGLRVEPFDAGRGSLYEEQRL